MTSYRERIYDEYLTTTYAARNDLTTEGLQQLVAHYVRHFGPHFPQNRNVSVLEIGCGSGAMLRALRQAGFRTVHGIDIAPQQVEFCRAQGLSNVECADAISYLRETRKKFGLIVMSDVLEHLGKDEVVEVLTLVREHLSPAGRIVARVPNMSNPLNIRTRYVDFTHEVGFSKETLGQVLRISGFGVTAVYGEYEPHRRLLARVLFDHILWRGFRAFCRHVMGLHADVERGKNLIAVAELPGTTGQNP